MRIALVTDYYLPTLGGVQTAVKAQAETLRDAGHEVTVFCPRGPRDGVGDSAVALPVSPIFRPDGYPFAWSPRRLRTTLVREFADRRIDVVHTHSEMFAALAALRAASALGIPKVHTMHGRIDVYTRNVLPVPAVTMHLLARLHARQVPHRGVRIAGGTPATATRGARAMWRVMAAHAAAVDEVLVPSPQFRRLLAAQGVTTRMTVVGNGLEPSVRERIRSITSPQRADGRLRLAWVGRLSPEKRPLVFVEAMALLGDAVHGDVVGSGVADREVARASASVSALHLHGAVSQDRVLEIVSGADLVVSTSQGFDVQPMALLEAIAGGVPVLVCDPDLVEALPEGAALVAETPDAAGVAASVRRLLADPARFGRARTAAQAAREATAQRADGLVAVYERVTAGVA